MWLPWPGFVTEEKQFPPGFGEVNNVGISTAEVKAMEN